MWGYWRWITSLTKQTVKKEFSIFLSHIRLQKQHSSLMYWLKICKAWVRSQLRWAWNWLKLNVTSSNVLRIIIHWLLARRDVGLTQRILIPKKHSLYRALKHSIRQHKLDLILRWLDSVILWGYHPTLKLSGIPTFTFIVSLTYSMDSI